MEQILIEQTAPVSGEGKQDTVAQPTGEVSLKKFKDVNALEKAYSSLECEFTKRSQRLKELSRENDEYKKMIEITTSPQSEQSSSGQENLIKLIENHPQMASWGQDLSVDGQKNGGYDLVSGYIEALEEKVKQLEENLNDENLLKRHIEGTAIKDEIVRDYLKSVISDFGGTRLLSGGGVISIAPPNKPKTIAEAGAMARQYLKK